MKYFLAPEYLSHFRQHHQIELEGLFTENQSKRLYEEIQKSLKERIETLSPYNQFLGGRDLWRENKVIYQMITKQNFLEVVAELTNQSKLRLGYDQYIPTPTIIEEEYIQFLNRSTPVDAISSIQGIVAGAIIALKVDQSSMESTFFPSKPGNVLIFNNTVELPWAQLTQMKGNSYLMVAYTEPAAVYVYRELDPNVAYLKTLGYHLNDKLNDRLHPIVYRR